MQLRVRKSQLNGSVRISGAKNSALRLLAASLLTDGDVVLRNYPAKLRDAQIHVGMLEVLGKKCDLLGEDAIRISNNGESPTALVWKDRSIRNTLLILGALAAKRGYGAVPHPGGCKLGERAYDLHVMLLEKLGARVWETSDYLFAEAPSTGLVGTDIHLPIRSTGATENAILAGTLARGTTNVWNPHIRPEILDLVSMINGMGGQVKMYGQERIEIQGVTSLDGIDHRVIPDNMEAITWLIGSVMTGGDVEIFNFPYDDLQVPLIHLKSSGARFHVNEESMIVRGGKCYPVEISTGPHPGINSDVQPLLAAYGVAARGESKIVDLRFPGRYAYAAEMQKMGAQSRTEGNMLVIDGRGGNLAGATVRALDLRAGAALTLCGLIAEGETVIEDAWQIERGYNQFMEKIRVLGGDVSELS